MLAWRSYTCAKVHLKNVRPSSLNRVVPKQLKKVSTGTVRVAQYHVGLEYRPPPTRNNHTPLRQDFDTQVAQVHVTDLREIVLLATTPVQTTGFNRSPALLKETET
jgi:hypothetical protein